jgi:hypothetical protein
VELNLAGMECDTCTIRRVILVEVSSAADQPLSGKDLLAGGVTRTPVGFIDLDAKDGRIIHVRPVAKSTAWKDVPTPEI